MLSFDDSTTLLCQSWFAICGGSNVQQPRGLVRKSCKFHHNRNGREIQDDYLYLSPETSLELNRRDNLVSNIVVLFEHSCLLAETDQEWNIVVIIRVKLNEVLFASWCGRAISWSTVWNNTALRKRVAVAYRGSSLVVQINDGSDW